MKWIPGRRSANLEDRRGASSGGGGLGFGGGGGFRGGKLGLGGIVVLVVLSLVFKQDFLGVLGGGEGMSTSPAEAVAPLNDPAEEPLVQFVSFVLDDAQTFWRSEAPKLGTQFQDATLVLFRDATETACGFGQAASGPFYCPGDHRVYIDLGFFQELRDRFKAGGDFAQAYVLAHEIGHHVQNLLGTSREVQRAQQQGGDGNALSVRLELQADCYAGVWGHSAAQRQLLHSGDVEEGLAAASAVGDDRISAGRLNPDSFTHGSSAQRMEWFRRGFERGDSRACDTFRG